MVTDIYDTDANADAETDNDFTSDISQATQRSYQSSYSLLLGDRSCQPSFCIHLVVVSGRSLVQSADFIQREASQSVRNYGEMESRAWVT